MANQYELYSSYLNELNESQAVIDIRKKYEDLLTSSLSTAESDYTKETESAAQQASYDISGAYANYLRQQRNIVAQGHLEKGYKEEVSNALHQQYESVYNQATATQAEATAKAYTSYLKSAQEAYSTATKSKEEIDKLVQERASRSAKWYDLYNQFRRVDNTDLLESSVYNPTTGELPVYALNKETGEYELTEFGKDWYNEGFTGRVAFNDAGKSYTMSFEDWIKAEEDEKLLTEWQQYASEIMKDVAGIEMTTNDKGESVLPAYDSASGRTTKLKTAGYIESFNTPDKLDLNGNDFALIDFGKSGKSKVTEATDRLTNYATTIGLSDTEMASAVKAHLLKNVDSLVGSYEWKDSRYNKDYGKNKFIEQINKITNAATLKSFLMHMADRSDYNTSTNKLFDEIISATKQAAITKYRGA